MSHRLSPLVFNETVHGRGRMQKKKEWEDLPGYVSKKMSHAKKSLRPARELSCQQHPASSEQQWKWLYLVIGVSGCAIWFRVRERSIAIEHVFHHFQEREVHCLDSCTLAVLSWGPHVVGQRDVGSNGGRSRMVWMTLCLPWLSHLAISETSRTLCASLFFSPLFHSGRDNSISSCLQTLEGNSQSYVLKAIPLG